jgi:hypothetical protein
MHQYHVQLLLQTLERDYTRAVERLDYYERQLNKLSSDNVTDDGRTDFLNGYVKGFEVSTKPNQRVIVYLVRLTGLCWAEVI